MSWTPSRIAILKDMWADGESATAIGNALGVTKNSILGKAHRLELPPHVAKPKWNTRAQYGTPEPSFMDFTRPKATAEPVRKPVWRAKPKPAPKVHTRSHVPLRPPVPRPKPYEGPGVRLMDIGHNQCRYPMGGRGADVIFCAGPTKEGESWCSFHRTKCFQPRTESNIRVPQEAKPTEA